VDRTNPDHDAGYLVEGIGGSVMPANSDPGVIDVAERVMDEESFDMACGLIREEGLLVGVPPGRRSLRRCVRPHAGVTGRSLPTWPIPGTDTSPGRGYAR
jgi:hypothetical protein